MDPQWQYNPLIIPLSVSVVILIILIILGFRRRQNPVAVPYLFFMGCLLIWMVTSLLEVSTLNLQLSLLFADISFLGITFFPIAWLSVVMVYIGKGKDLRRILSLLVIVPILTNIIILTNPLHNLWRGDSYRDLTTWFPITMYEYGSWYTIHLIFSLSVTFIAIFLLVQSLFSQKKKPYRIQIVILLMALSLPLGVEILHQMGISPIPHYNTTTLVFPISGLLVAWVLLRHQFLDLMPIARDLVIESMQDLMLVLDDKGRIVDLNPIARHTLFQNNNNVIGINIATLFPDQHKLIKKVVENNFLGEEIKIARDGKTLLFETSVSPIRHQDNILGGWILLLRDISARRQTEQALTEQAQQVAILAERQRIARELHDSVNQTLFAARMLADLLPRAIDKKPEKIPEYAQNIQQLIHETSAEIRLMLLELYPDALTQTDLGSLIKQLCDAHLGSTKTIIAFSATPLIYLEREEQLAFYRIAQEALHNVYKHTQATKITVELISNHDGVKLTIQDNGTGFDPKNISGEHFGLNNMTQRAKDIGAILHIDSKINLGTKITATRKTSS